MKRVFIYSGLVLLSALACKKEEPDIIKLDYTNLYESAAYALASARRNYDDALKTNDAAAIQAAQKRLQSAQNVYAETKQNIDVETADPKKKKLIEEVELTARKPVNTGDALAINHTNATAHVAEISTTATAPNLEKEKRRKRQDSMAAVRKANYEAFKTKAKSDLQKDTVKVRLQRFNQQVKDFFEGKSAK